MTMLMLLQLLLLGQVLVKMGEYSRNKQQNRLILSKKISLGARIGDALEPSFHQFRKSTGKESLYEERSTIKRKNSATESGIYKEFQNDILVQT